MKNKSKVYKIIRNICIALCVLVVLCALTLFICYNTMTTDMQVFLKKDLNREQEENIRKQIELICGTNEIEYISKDDALQQMKEQFGNNDYLLDNYSGENNIFPSSYKLKIHFNKQKYFKEEITNITGVEKVSSNSFYITIISTFYKPKTKNIDNDHKPEEYKELTTTEVENIVTTNVNNGKIYIDDVGKIISVDNANIKETIDNIEFWQVDITYEKSSLSAPIGTNYKGQSYKGTYYFAYNQETKQIFKYIFSYDDYNRLKGWSTKGFKNNSDYWVD